MTTDNWIDVKERLPNENDTSDDRYNEVATWQIGRKRITLMKYWEIKHCPFTTHWQPLPSPPKTTTP